MSLYSFNVSHVSRSPAKGSPGNSIASAAYISRERLTDDRTGDIYDYRDKGGIEFQGVFTPKGAPKWMQDRETLWNAVEEREDESTRPDQARSARRFIIALPHELNERERLWLVKDFAREMARKGMVVDFAIHKPDAKGDQRNYHVHMLMTTRVVTAEGFGNKVREWNTKENLSEWRERWAELGSKALDRAGHGLEAERFKHAHLSLEAQKGPALDRGDEEFLKELDRVPTPHLGPNVLAMEEKGIRTEKGAAHQRIVEHNDKKAREQVDKQFFRTPEDMAGIRRDITEQDRDRPIVRDIYAAYQEANGARNFVEKLKEKNLHIAMVRDSDIPGNPNGTRPPRKWDLEPHEVGNFVVLTSWGLVYRLDEFTTGASSLTCQQFLKKELNTARAMSVTDKHNELYYNRQKGYSPGNEPDQKMARILHGGTGRILGSAFDALSSMIESLAEPEIKAPIHKPDMDEELLRKQREERDRGGRDR